MIDEDLAFEMVHFMLKANGQEPVGLDLSFAAFEIEVTNGNSLCALDLVVNSRYGKTPLFADLQTLQGYQFRIDQHQQFISSL